MKTPLELLEGSLQFPVVSSNESRGDPSNHYEGHDARMAGHIERVQREYNLLMEAEKLCRARSKQQYPGKRLYQRRVISLGAWNIIIYLGKGGWYWKMKESSKYQRGNGPYDSKEEVVEAARLILG